MFKSCIPAEIPTYLNKQKMDTLHQASVEVNDYSLTHKTAFRRTCAQPLDQSENMPGEEGVSSIIHDSSLSTSRDLISNTNASSSCLPAGLTCFYCKKRGHIMSECHTLEKTIRWLLLMLS